MAELDVVARLQLRAEAFTADTNRAFGNMRDRAAAAASDIQRPFAQTFGEVKKLAADALKLPRTAGGGLDLSREIASLKTAALEADRNATALQELASAQIAAAAAGRGNVAVLQAEAQASAIAAAAEEKAASAARQRVVSLEAVQAELSRSVSTTVTSTREIEANSAAAARSGAAAGQQRAGFQQLSYQLGDVATQYASGAKASVIFAQQSGQVIQALQMVSGNAKGVLGVLAGPWGIALSSALVVMTPWVAKLWEGGEAAKKAKEEAEKQTRAVDALAEAQGRATRTAQQQLEIDAQTLASDRDKRRETLALADARLKLAQANLASYESAKSLMGGGAESATAAEAVMIRQIGALQAAVTAARGEFGEKSTAAGRAAARAAVGRATIARDPRLATEERYGTAVNAAVERFGSNTRAVTAAVNAAADARDRELKRIDATEKALSGPSRRRDGDTATAGQVVKMLRQALPGVQVTATTNGKHVKNSYHYSGQAVDFVPAGGMGSMTKADVRRMFEARKLDIVELLGPGDKGHSDHFHVAWTKSKHALDDFSDAARRAKRKAADLGELVRDITGLDAFADTYKPDPLSEFMKRRAGPLIPETPSLSGGSMERWLDGERRDREAAENAAQHRLKVEGEVYQTLGTVYEAVFSGRTRAITDDLARYGAQALSRVASRGIASLVTNLPPGLQNLLKGSLQEGSGYGALGGSVFASITGGRNNATAAAVGGVLGDVAGKALGPAVSSAIGGSLGKALGGAAGPIGSVVGGILGNVLGSALAGRKGGEARLTGSGSATVTSTGGAYRQAVGGAATSVQDGLARIAEQLGATVGAFDLIIGQHNGSWRVRDSAGGWNGKGGLNFKGDSARGLKDFGDNQAAAIAYAIKNAILDGAITGISEASQRLLRQAGDDVEKALNKALMIESIPKQLKAMLDPAGAAVDALNEKYQGLIAALNEGGASVDQISDAQRLYKLELAQVRESTVSASASLKDFLTSMKVGGDSPLSLRDQSAAASASLQPFLDQITAGEKIDQAKYQQAAKAYLDVERQLYGSTQAFFDKFDRIQEATTKAIAAIDNAAPIGSGTTKDPFAELTAKAAASTAANTQAANEIAEQNADLLGRIAAAMERMSGGGAAGFGSDFIGEARGFALPY